MQHTAPGVYLRCVAFADADTGWVGTLTPARRLFHTTDGGANWTNVTGLPALAPAAVCGLSVVSASVVYASGTNRPNDVPRMMKTTDGGATWTAWDMSAHATSSSTPSLPTHCTAGLWAARPASPRPPRATS